jgi:hypothetical protein
MKKGILFFIILLPIVAVATPEIYIDKVTNRYITGHVVGVKHADVKVVVYWYGQKTWYKQPYSGYAEGYSWASVGEDGKWYLGLVKKRVKRRTYSEEVWAAVLLPKDYQAPNKLKDPRRLPYLSITFEK